MAQLPLYGYGNPRVMRDCIRAIIALDLAFSWRIPAQSLLFCYEKVIVKAMKPCVILILTDIGNSNSQ